MGQDGYASGNRLWASHHCAAAGESQPVSSMIDRIGVFI
jgi:hypothetical protein